MTHSRSVGADADRAPARVYVCLCVQVVDKNTPWSGGLVAVNSFGFGGANAHVILESQAGARPARAQYAVPRLVLASGRTDEACRALLQHAAAHAQDAELHALLDAVHAHNIPGHVRRGYALLATDPPVEEIIVSIILYVMYSESGACPPPPPPPPAGLT